MMWPELVGNEYSPCSCRGSVIVMLLGSQRSWFAQVNAFCNLSCGSLQPIARAVSSCWLPDPLGLQALKNAFKADTVNSMSSLLPPSIWKKVCTRSKIGQGTRLVPGKSQGSWPEAPKTLAQRQRKNWKRWQVILHVCDACTWMNAVIPVTTQLAATPFAGLTKLWFSSLIVVTTDWSRF